MSEITVRELRNRGGDVLDRVARGEALTVTRDASDATIAATALANGLPVYTCNPNDFAGIEGLEVVPVPPPEVSAVGDAPAE